MREIEPKVDEMMARAQTLAAQLRGGRMHGGMHGGH